MISIFTAATEEPRSEQPANQTASFDDFDRGALIMARGGAGEERPN